MKRMETGEWSRLVDEHLALCESNRTEQGQLLLSLFDLLQAGPAHICDPIRPELAAPELEKLIGCGAFESAALRLLGKCGLMMSRSEEGLVIATVVLPPSETDYSFSAFSEAPALCGALATSLLEKLKTGVEPQRTFRQSPHD